MSDDTLTPFDRLLNGFCKPAKGRKSTCTNQLSLIVLPKISRLSSRTGPTHPRRPIAFGLSQLLQKVPLETG